VQEDNIFRVFGGDRIKGMMGVFGIDDVPLESNMLSKSLNEAQKKVETYFYDIRKQVRAPTPG
jgi:preprotein translocase subunit SecA